MLVAALTLSLAVAGCTGDDDPEPSKPSATPSAAVKPAKLTFGVWGAEAEVQAYQGVVDAYNDKTPEAKVKIEPFASRDELMASLDSGTVPDVFLVSRGDLTDLREKDLNQPIGDLLDERDVDFGDGYSRPALEAFASDRNLQCMPYGVSPMVIYYNKALVDFDAMAERELSVPSVDDDNLDKKPIWSLNQFQVAADYASRPRKGIAGFYVAPSLRGLAPFVYSGGGQLFDDDEAPTSLAFSSGDTRSALEKVLPLLRDPRLSLSAEQLAQKDPVEWFKEGKLGMIAGFRSLTPELRADPALDFDVMPMPIVDDAATIGDLTGVCISKETPEVAEAADFLVDFISAESVSAVAGAGYLSPANTTVALSPAFLQPDQVPLHALVFNSSIKSMRIPPLLGNYDELETAVAEPLRMLLEVAVPDLDALTEEIDLASQTVLAPEEEQDEESESPSEEPSEEP